MCWSSGNPRMNEGTTRNVDQISVGHENHGLEPKRARRIDGGLMIGERGGESGIRDKLLFRECASDEGDREDGSEYTALRQRSVKKRHFFGVRALPASGLQAGFQSMGVSKDPGRSADHHTSFNAAAANTYNFSRPVCTRRVIKNWRSGLLGFETFLTTPTPHSSLVATSSSNHEHRVPTT